MNNKSSSHSSCVAECLCVSRKGGEERGTGTLDLLGSILFKRDLSCLFGVTELMND